MILEIPRRFRVVGILIVLVCLLYFFTSTHTSKEPAYQAPETGQPSHQQDGSAIRPLQSSDLQQAPADVSEECALRYDDAYLQAYSRGHTNYCDTASASQLRCFSHGAPGKQIDTFCAGGPSQFQSRPAGFDLNCTLRSFGADEVALQLPQYNAFPQYWYGTGPRYVLNGFVHLATEIVAPIHSPVGYAYLIKREDNNQNLWHTMMEIMSLMMSVDVLSISKDDHAEALFKDEDRARSQVVLLDNLPDGPYYNLWSIFAGLKTVRLADFDSQQVKPEKILAPLPGGSNPFWAGDWEDLECGKSSLFRRFSNRVLAFYGLEPAASAGRLRLTYILRKQKRRLINEEQYFAKLKSMYPQVEMQIIDYAGLDFAQQVELSHNTDILMGVHGAGLTHGAFMPEGSTLIEILPKKLNHKGFKNMARFLGHQHFSTHAEALESPESNGDWQHDDLVLPESEFMALAKEAIEAALARQKAG